MISHFPYNSEFYIQTPEYYVPHMDCFTEFFCEEADETVHFSFDYFKTEKDFDRLQIKSPGQFQLKLHRLHSRLVSLILELGSGVFEISFTFQALAQKVLKTIGIYGSMDTMLPKMYGKIPNYPMLNSNFIGSFYHRPFLFHFRLQYCTSGQYLGSSEKLRK